MYTHMCIYIYIYIHLYMCRYMIYMYMCIYSTIRMHGTRPRHLRFARSSKLRPAGYADICRSHVQTTAVSNIYS